MPEARVLGSILLPIPRSREGNLSNRVRKCLLQAVRAADGEQNWVEWGEHWWQGVLKERRDELRVADPELGARIMLMAVRGAIDAAIEREPDLLEQPEFVKGSIYLACRYLL